MKIKYFKTKMIVILLLGIAALFTLMIVNAYWAESVSLETPKPITSTYDITVGKAMTIQKEISLDNKTRIVVHLKLSKKLMDQECIQINQNDSMDYDVETNSYIFQKNFSEPVRVFVLSFAITKINSYWPLAIDFEITDISNPTEQETIITVIQK